MRARWAGVLLVILVAVATVLSGCGVTVDPVAQAANRTSAVTTMRMTLRLEIPDSQGGIEVVTGAGAFDSASQRFELTVDYTPLFAALGQSVDGRSRIVMDHLVMYMDFPFLQGKLPGGKQWVSFDLEKAGKTLGVDFAAALQQANQSDPRQSLAALKHVSSLVAGGHARIRGVETTHYAGLVDIRKAVDRLPAAARPGFEQILDRLIAATGGRTMYPVDVWVDGAGFVRRFREESPSGQGSQTIVEQFDLFGFGRPVVIALPDPATVADVTSMFGS
jgi:hypothetical protein